jgi:hypothetical protein
MFRDKRHRRQSVDGPGRAIEHGDPALLRADHHADIDRIENGIEQLALAGEIVFDTLAYRNILNEGSEEMGFPGIDQADRHLDRKLFSGTAQGGKLQAFADDTGTAVHRVA